MGSLSLVDWLIVLIIFAAIIGLPVLCIYTGRRTRPPSGPVGFGGWLLLLAVSQTITPLITLVLLVAMLTVLRRLGEVVLLVPLLVFQVYVTVFMYRRRSRFPELFVIEQVVSLAVLLIVENSSSSGMSADVKSDFIKNVISAAIWSAYVFKSIRVKNTFVKNGRASPVAMQQDT